MTVVGWTNIGELATADPTAGEGPVGIVRDAAVVAVDGRIAWIGPASDVPDVDVSHDMAGAAMLPGFVDAHVHYPQAEIIASYGEQLLEWLNTYVFPAERKYSNKQYARTKADFFSTNLPEMAPQQP